MRNPLFVWSFRLSDVSGNQACRFGCIMPITQIVLHQGGPLRVSHQV